MKNSILVVFGKLPIKGFSKTRLGKDIGEDMAYQAYHAFIADFFYNAQSYQGPIYIYATPLGDETERFFKKYSKNFFFQDELPFFERLKKIFQNHNGWIHLTGTDIPDFPFEVLEEDSADLVLGPDKDGGYYYLGTDAKNYEIFDIDTHESADTVFEATLKKAKQLRLKTKIVKEWSDIDDLSDFRATLDRSSVEVIPQTHQVYNKLKNQ